MNPLERIALNFEVLSDEVRRERVQFSTPEEAAEQARNIIAGLKQEYNFDDEEARQHLAVQISEAAVNKGGDPDTVFNSYPKELKDVIRYTPQELTRNQQITKWGVILAPLLFTAGAGLVTFAAFRGLAAAAPWIARAIGLAGQAKNASQVTNFLTIARQAAFPKVLVPGVLGGLATGLAWYTNTAVNNWNDVFHWGPSFGQQAANKLTSGGSASGKSTFVPLTTTRSRSQTTAKPKLFTGTFFSGTLAPRGTYVRKVDDQITSIQDMVDDLEINLVNWYKVLPGYLNYDLVVVNNPKDELGQAKLGTWVVCNLYLTNSVHKRLLVENIILGPVDPAVYYPEHQSIQSIQVDVPRLLKPEEIKALSLPSGNEYTVDAQGNVVAGFFKGWDTKRDDSPPAAGSASAPAPASALDASGTPAGPAGGGALVASARQEAEAPGARPVGNIVTATQQFPTKVTVTANSLMVRSAPNTNAPLAGSQRLVKGDTFIAETVEPGENVDGIEWWWKSQKGNYVWVGGTDWDRAGGLPYMNQGNTAIVDEPKPAFGGLFTPPKEDFGGLFNQPAPVFRSLQPASPLKIFNPEAAPAPVDQGQVFPRTVTVVVDGLAVRSAPDTSAPLSGSQRLNKGDTFTATGLVDGKVVDGNGKWWISSKGNYVWSGGAK